MINYTNLECAFALSLLNAKCFFEHGLTARRPPANVDLISIGKHNY